MTSYTHLTYEQRYQIVALKRVGTTMTRIAEALGCHKSTISREIARNTGKRGYRALQAHEAALARVAKNAKTFTEADWSLVSTLLREDLSPEQISGRLQMTGVLSISHESIYLHAYKDKEKGGDLHQHLRCQKKRKKRYGSGKDRRGKIPNRVDISDRPSIVDEKTRIGDWEADTVIGKGQQGVIATVVDRKSRYTIAGIMENRSATLTTETIVRQMMAHKNVCHTITFDNGSEFFRHTEIANALNCKTFFAKPYHSWERGCNENTNGLLRQYFPKNKNLLSVRQEELQSAVDKLNHRPRKCLGYKTPFEVFFNKKSCWKNPVTHVALRI